MKKILVIDCCIREELSATRKLYEKYLARLENSDVKIEKLYLMQEDLKPFTNDDIILRDNLLKSGNLEHDIFKYAKQFVAADEILVAAPYWDLSFPSMLRVYFEKVSVAGITFGYEGAKSVGYCKADRILYFSTCGGFIKGVHLGVEYVKQLAEMFGIGCLEKFIVEGLDVDSSIRDNIVDYI